MDAKHGMQFLKLPLRLVEIRFETVIQGLNLERIGFHFYNNVSELLDIVSFYPNFKVTSFITCYFVF